MSEELFIREVGADIVTVIPLLFGRARVTITEKEHHGQGYRDGW